MSALCCILLSRGDASLAAAFKVLHFQLAVFRKSEEGVSQDCEDSETARQKFERTIRIESLTLPN